MTAGVQVGIVLGAHARTALAPLAATALGGAAAAGTVPLGLSHQSACTAMPPSASSSSDSRVPCMGTRVSVR